MTNHASEFLQVTARYLGFELGTGPSRRPTQQLAPFSVERFWDADSTPPAMAALSRKVAQLAPRSGARTPTIEAAVVLASLMHDVAYYYGGDRADKAAADALFGDQIRSFAGMLDPSAIPSALVTSAVDVAAVTAGGGYPFRESYSWGYGFEPGQRGYVPLDAGQSSEVSRRAQETFKTVIRQIADQSFAPSKVLLDKLGSVSPEYRSQLVEKARELARKLEPALQGGTEQVPGFGTV